MLSALLGAAFVVLADAAGRVAYGGYAPPVGITLGLIAIPGYGWALSRAAGAHRAELVVWGLLALGYGAFWSEVSSYVARAT